MTNQELFDKVKTHLLSQMEKSVAVYDDGDERCAYQGPDGLRCAIGCLIPDEKYSEEFEGRGASYKPVAEAAGLEFEVESLKGLGDLVTGPQVDLALRLQQVHDYHHPGRWETELRYVAESFGLTF